jgi:mannose-6-phosphate isomerase-like protein (cupin superfamily)
MGDYTGKRISEMETFARGGMRKVRGELGITSFGIQQVTMPPNYDGYPMHSHAHDGQEELYVALEGSATLEIEGGDTFELDGDMVVRVGPGERRKITPGPQGIRMLVIGGMPGSAFSVTDFTEVGAPDPFAG